MDNQIGLIIAIFFLLLSFIGVFRKPLTILALLYVLFDILSLYIPLDNQIIILSMSVALTIVLGALTFKFRFFYGLIFGFIITYMSFYHFATCVDAVMSLINGETNFLSNLLADLSYLPHNLFRLVCAGGVGVIFGLLNKRGLEFISSFGGTFMIILFVIDIFRGGVSVSIPFDLSLITDAFIHLDSIYEKSSEIYMQTLTNPNYLNFLLALPIAVIVSGVTTFIKREKYDFL